MGTLAQSSPVSTRSKGSHGVWTRVRYRLTEDIWARDLSRERWVNRLTYHSLRVLTIVVRGFAANRCRLRAAALTYVTVFSLIPLLALAFAVAGMFRGRIQEQINVLKGSLIGKLAPASAGEFEGVTTKVNEFIEKYNSLSLGAIGAVVLVYCVINLLSQIEGALNESWGVKRKRSLILSIWVYWGVVTLGTLVMAASLSITGLAESIPLLKSFLDIGFIARVVQVLTPYLITSLFLALVYKFMPNAAVRLGPAALGGIIGGGLWELSKQVYVFYVAEMLHYGDVYFKVYSGLAAIPLFLVWVHFSWIIFLLGAEICYAVQNMENYRMERDMKNVSQRYRDFLALRIMLSVSRYFASGKMGPSVAELAEETKISHRVVQELVTELTQAGMLAETTHVEARYVPAMPLEQITPHSVLKQIHTNGDFPASGEKAPDLEFAAELLRKEELASEKAVGTVSFKILVEDLKHRDS